MGGGSAVRTAAMRLAWLVPLKQRCPVTISYSTEPKAKMSDRASGSRPSSCSGDMYRNVPRRVPCLVSGLSPVGGPPGGEADGGLAALSFAIPKSSSFVPDLVIMTLAGLRSRWTIPFRWAQSRACAISIP